MTSEFQVELELKLSHRVYGPEAEVFNDFYVSRNDGDHKSIDVKINGRDKSSVFSRAHHLAKVATYALSRCERHLRNGAPYFIVNWKDHKEEFEDKEIYDQEGNVVQIESQVGISEYATIRSPKSVELAEIEKYFYANSQDAASLEHYYDACSSHDARSKFFNLFLVIERLEGSPEFLDRFQSEVLFSDEEKKRIRESIGFLSDRKKSALTGCFSRTEKSRSEKIQIFFQERSALFGDGHPISIETVGKILEQRNKLFHSSSQFDESVLYDMLFPLVRTYLDGTFRFD